MLNILGKNKIPEYNSLFFIHKNGIPYQDIHIIIRITVSRVENVCFETSK